MQLPSLRNLPTAVSDRFHVHVLHRGLADTARHTELRALGFEHADRIDYIPSPWLFTRRMLRDHRIGRDDVFVDFGSGKGRIVYMVARHYPFGRVIGVEVAEDLNAIARENLRRARHRLKCKNVDLVTADASEFPIPREMTFAYLFNPFVGDTFRGVLANICRSLDEFPRPLTLIYANPVEREAIERTGRFRLLRETRGARRLDWHRIAIYLSL